MQMQRKTILSILQATNNGNCTQYDLKPSEIRSSEPVTLNHKMIICWRIIRYVVTKIKRLFTHGNRTIWPKRNRGLVMTGFGKVIHWEWRKRLKYDNVDKQEMIKRESVWESETNKIIRDFKIYTDHPIPSRKLGLVLKTENIVN